MNRRYVASLAVAAIAILVAGSGVRRWLRRAEPAPVPVVAPSEASAFQQLSQEGQVRQLSSFLDGRAADVAALVEFVPASNASGLRWRGDVVITTYPDRPIVALRVTRGDTTPTPTVARSDSLRGEWALVVARRPDDGFVSTAGVIGGRLRMRCGDQVVAEYVFGAPLREGFAGAGVFDLAGRVIGIVGHCGDRLAALPVDEVTRLLNVMNPLGTISRSRFGFAAVPLDSAARTAVRADSGLLVTEVLDGSPADAAGWTPGDVIATVAGVAVDDTAAAPAADSLAFADSVVVVIRRGTTRRSTTLTTRPTFPSERGPDIGVSLGDPPAGVLIDRVRPGSAADRAGLRRGDRLVRVGTVAVRSAPEATRLLERLRRTDGSTLIVFRRDSISRAVLIGR